MKHREPTQTVRLEQKNAALKSEIKDIRKQIISLNTHLDLLAKQDEQFRLVAGLEPLSEDVKRVGIGGPGGSEIMEDAAAASAATHVSELLRRARLLSFSWREAKSTLDDKTERMQATPSIVPTNGFFTSGFTRNRFHPILQYARPHEGVDITAPKGTPIVAAAKGVVLRAEYDRDYGYVVDIDHGYGVSTRYAHASKTLVHRGQAVTRGERIALVGETGLAVGPHLHYEVRLNGKPANPLKYFLNTNAIVD
ncbi:MAG TPA: M23 family metallopeptidase [Longimicrobiales bacterium]|nr:M23 family metallopeptidase [Longimicrobiales bacterium]